MALESAAAVTAEAMFELDVFPEAGPFAIAIASGVDVPAVVVPTVSFSEYFESYCCCCCCCWYCCCWYLLITCTFELGLVISGLCGEGWAND